MLNGKHFQASGWGIAVGALGYVFSSFLMADYVPFPGKIQVSVVSVDAPSEIVVSYETWPGFRRNTLIKLPGIDICEREKAAKAMEFTQQFIGEAEKIFVKDMRMETSASEEAYSDILTNHGSLSQALKAEGLARPDSVAPDTSWCQ